jgi:Flp pilus assembly protein TadD
MRRHVIEIALVALAGGSAVAQQNIPCPEYMTDLSRIDPQDPLYAREVQLCLDDQEIPQEPISAQRMRRTPKAARQEVELGMAAAHNKLHEEALQHFVEAVRIDQYYWDGVSHLGGALVRMHQPSQALEFLMRAMMIDSRQASTHVNMAWAMLFLGKPAMAEGYARRALGLAPESEAANYVLSWALILQSRRSDDLSRALGIAKRRLPDASNLMMLRGD